MENKLFESTRQFLGNAIQRGNLIYPDEQVIRFMKKYYRDSKNVTVLDFGCGGGRNTLALINEGYNVIAMDYTESAIRMTKEKCHKFGVEDVQIIQNSGFEIPLSPNSVDAVVADGSFCYYSKQDTIKITENLHRVMKNDALLWTLFRTRNDSLYAKGKQLDEGLFEMSDGTGREGCTYFFADEADIREIFTSSGFEIVSIDDFSYSINDRAEVNSWFHVVAKKIIY